MTDIFLDVLPAGVTSGRYIIITETGSTYTFDADAQTLTRHPDGKRVKQWLDAGGVPPKVEVLRPSDTGDGAILRADGDPIDVVVQGQVTVGHSAQFVLDLLRNGVYTHRVTSPVSTITQVA